MTPAPSGNMANAGITDPGYSSGKRANGRVNDSASDGAQRPDDCDGVGMNSATNEPVCDRIDNTQISVFEPVRENLHAAPIGREARGPVARGIPPTNR